MPLRRLRIESLRCLHEVDLELDSDWSFLIGPNGAGKTSFLEAIHCLGRGRSFRTRQNARLVQRGHQGFSVYGEVWEGSQRHRLGVGFDGKRLEARVDGEAAQGMTELATHLAVFVIEPRVHQIIEAGPSERRRFIDGGVFHVEHAYLAEWRAYRRALAQRNAALKAARGRSEVEAWTEAFVAAGERIDESRGAYVSGLDVEVASTSAALLGRTVEVTYRRGWAADVTLAEALDTSWPADRSTGFTQVGPHRADLRIRLDGGDVRDAASRGQQKLVAAALVVGQVRHYELAGRASSTLLVDDPVAELDGDALRRLLVELAALGSQKVITALDGSAAALHPTGRVFHVEQGRVAPVV
jgi:DNA replication and repair protein RecF